LNCRHAPKSNAVLVIFYPTCVLQLDAFSVVNVCLFLNKSERCIQPIKYFNDGGLGCDSCRKTYASGESLQAQELQNTNIKNIKSVNNGARLFIELYSPDM
jgi:hypothetical protein